MRRLASAVRAWLAALLRPPDGSVGRCVAGASARPPL